MTPRSYHDDRYTALSYAPLYQNEWRMEDNAENTQAQ